MRRWRDPLPPAPKGFPIGFPSRPRPIDRRADQRVRLVLLVSRERATVESANRVRRRRGRRPQSWFANLLANLRR